MRILLGLIILLKLLLSKIFYRLSRSLNNIRFDSYLWLLNYLIHRIFIVRKVVLFVIKVAHEEVGTLRRTLILKDWLQQRVLKELVGLDSYPCLVVLLPVDKCLILFDLLHKIGYLGSELGSSYQPLAYTLRPPWHFNFFLKLLFLQFILFSILILNLLDHLHRHRHSIEPYVPEISHQLKPLSFLDLREKHVPSLLVIRNFILVNIHGGVEIGGALLVIEACRREIFVTHVDEILS